MLRKAAAVFMLLLGIAAILYGYHVCSDPVTLGSCAECPGGAADPSLEGQLVLTTGRISFGKGASDPVFGIETDSLILIRTVEMYQFIEKENGSEMTEGFSTEHEVLTSTGLQNPQFPEGLASEVFTAEDIRIGSQLGLSPEYAMKLALDSYSDLSRQYPLKDYTDLPYIEMTSPELGSFNGYYASPGSEWEIGDLRISFRVLDGSSLGEFTAVGRQRNGVLQLEEYPCSIYDRSISTNDLFPDISGAAKTVFILLAAAGTLFIALSVILFCSGRKKGRKNG